MPSSYQYKLIFPLSHVIMTPMLKCYLSTNTRSKFSMSGFTSRFIQLAIQDTRTNGYCSSPACHITRVLCRCMPAISSHRITVIHNQEQSYFASEKESLRPNRRLLSIPISILDSISLLSRSTVSAPAVRPYIRVSMHLYCAMSRRREWVWILGQEGKIRNDCFAPRKKMLLCFLISLVPFSPTLKPRTRKYTSKSDSSGFESTSEEVCTYMQFRKSKNSQAIAQEVLKGS